MCDGHLAFDTYSSSLDEGQIYGDYSYVAPMATDANGGKTTPLNWTAWNGQNMDYIGNYIKCVMMYIKIQTFSTRLRNL